MAIQPRMPKVRPTTPTTGVGIYEGVFTGLLNKDFVTPYLENAILSDTWPNSYTITIDSSPHKSSGLWYFHPSTHPLLPLRQLYYMFHPDTREQMLRERRTTSSYMAMSMGNAFHAVLQTQFQMAGVIASPKDIEKSFVDHERHISGRADFIFTHPETGERIPVEIKTQSGFAFDKQQVIKDSWNAQLQLTMDGLGYSKGVLLAMQSGYPFKFKEFVVTRDDAFLSEVYKKFDYVRECIALSQPPREICCTLDSPEMQKCPARGVCSFAIGG